MRPVDVGWNASARLRRVGWFLHASLVETKLRELERTVKAKFDPNQPRVPAGNPDGGQWTDAGGSSGGGSISGSAGSDTLLGGDDDDDLSNVPRERPQDIRARNRAIRRLARLVLRLIREDELGRRIGPILDLLNVGTWIGEDYSDHLQAHIDPPKTLEELHRAVSSTAPGTQIHHTVEQGPAENEGFPRSTIDAPDNLVRIPTFKHEQITGWFGKPNKTYKDMKPRDYLRGKDWAERRRVGLDALIEHRVLKP